VTKNKISQINKKLPDCPGVYIFKRGKEILYIGRATSIRNRVKSYFSKNLIIQRGRLISDMVQKATELDFKKTDSVLESIILEANLIKKYQPKYNTEEKDDKSFNYVVITKEDFPKVYVTRGRSLSLESKKTEIKIFFGPFPSSGALREALRFIRKIFPYRDEKCKLGSHKPCFNRQIGLCPGTCTGEISKFEYQNTVKQIIAFFSGKKKDLIKSLEKEMRSYADSLQFEKAQEIKRKMESMKHIQDVTFIKADDSSLTSFSFNDRRINKIEAYDIAHLGGKEVTGVLVVWNNGGLDKKGYRIFKIKSAKGGDDISALTEILQRRFLHKEWTYPDIVIVDGGENHRLYAAKEVQKFDKDIPVFSVVKDKRHRAKAFLPETLLAPELKSVFLKLNAEAHRFALKTHRKWRNKKVFVV
jgi:excinuclease ABC subunit C